MTDQNSQHPTAAEAYLRRLAEQGIDYIFANAGTDFPSIIEGLAKTAEQGTPVPNAIAIPHENLAVSMAYGHYMVSGRPQAVMLHVNVGTANAICALLNASRERVPMLVAAGRTPYTDSGHHGSRSIYIHWAQEMFDQAAMLREVVKWDYELRMPDQVSCVVDRALSLAMSDPKGPVYLTLPRELLATPMPGNGVVPRSQSANRPAVPDEATLAEAATILARAKRPVIITASLGRNSAAVSALAKLAERFALPVVSHVPKSVCLPTNHPMHLGYAPGPFVKEADAILVIECDVPWIPARLSPPPEAKIIQLGIDPLYGRYPLRSFPCDLAIAGDPVLTLPLLAEALAAETQKAKGEIEARRQRLAEQRAAQRQSIEQSYERMRHERPLHPAVVSRALDAIRGEDGILVSELGVLVEHLNLTKPGTYFTGSSAGGLGWGLGAALGAKLAAPDRLVIAAIGDGSYMFGNPTPAHFVARAYGLPVLFVVMNNKGWAAVRKATEGMYPEGRSRRANRMPLATLEPSPNFEKVVEASGGYGERVEAPEDLAPAIQRALHAVTVEKRQALLNVICGIPAARHF